MSGRIRLTAPPGYGAVVPLDKRRHAGLGLAADPDQRWCAALNAVFVNAAELVRAALDYPVAFAREPGSGEFIPMAVLGLRPRQNLFVDAQGRWQARRYLPAFVRRYPFCVAQLPTRDGSAGRRMICVQEDRLTRDGTPLFDEHGEPLPAWQPLAALIDSIENARQQTRVLTRRLEALDLLVPFDALALPQGAPHMRLQGLYRVDEARLETLQGRDLRTLMRKGELRAVYAHLLSLENFGRLLDLAIERGA